MKEDTKSSIKSIAKEIKDQANELRVDTLLSFLSTSDIISRFVDIEAREHPITRSGFNVLHLLILHNTVMMPTEISKRTFRSKHAVTKIIDTLEKQGFVKRINSDNNNDRRVRNVTITRKGIELVKKATTMSRGRSSKLLFRSLDETQVLEFNRILKILRKDALDLIQEFEEQRHPHNH